MAGRVCHNPQVAWAFALATVALSALLVLLPAGPDPHLAAGVMAALLLSLTVGFGAVVAGIHLCRPHLIPVQARRRTQAPPAWSITRVPRTPRRPRAPGGR